MSFSICATAEKYNQQLLARAVCRFQRPLIYNIEKMSVHFSYSDENDGVSNYLTRFVHGHYFLSNSVPLRKDQRSAIIPGLLGISFSSFSAFNLVIVTSQQQAG